MIVPVKNIVETVDLTPKDALLPLFECIVNSIISLMKSTIPRKSKEIQVRILRGDAPNQMTTSNIHTIHSIAISDNGYGFDDANFKSFETPFSKINKQYGCKGIGRFTALAAFKKIRICSNYSEKNNWKYREFEFDADKEISSVKLDNSTDKTYKTTVELIECFNPIVKDKTALSLEEIAQEIMHHCLIYYLNDTLPIIKVFDGENELNINELFNNLSKENERTFDIGHHSFKAYVTKTLKEGNRKNHYVYYCANSRVVGQPKNINKSLFAYPLNKNGQLFFLDVYVVSDYLNKKAYNARNGFAIPPEKEQSLFESDVTSFQEIEEGLVHVLEEEYEPHVKESQVRGFNELKNYIITSAPRYKSLLNNPSLLNSIPPNLTDDKKEEALYKISFNARRTVEKHIQEFISNKQISEETIEKIKQDIKDKTAFDIDSLADYMMRRKAIIDLFDKFLEADSEGKYKLEEDIHNIIFPMGLTNDELGYESHNLWLLDERFLTYKFIGSDKSITSFSQKKSSKEPDLICLDEKPQMFDNPIGFGDKSNGEINSMVIFEFKRPGGIAHQRSKSNYRWEFSELVEPYFDEFLYSEDKKNYKGKHVVLKKETPKFGFVIIDFLPPKLEEYNKDKGWSKTPFGTFYKMYPEKNMYIEVMTFTKLIEYAKNRHMPFFDKLFTPKPNF
jgi:hypothetical protein